jgi:succinoglycan biosynthesis protein ExoA
LAMSHPVGIGNATHRYPNYEGYAEGACFPMFRREIFEKVGLFDEMLIRNQDDDFNYRVARAGGKILISPKARCVYFVRETPFLLLKQYFQYGYWRVAVLRKHKLPASLRQLAPPAFFLSAALSLLCSILFNGWWSYLAAALLAGYISVLLAAGLWVAFKQGGRIGALYSFAVVILHMSYALGFLWGTIRGGFHANRSQKQPYQAERR